MKRYDVIVNGVQTTLLLSDEDAAARGLVHTPAPAPAPKAVPTKAKTPANKSRKPANKRAEAVEAAFGPKGATE